MSSVSFVVEKMKNLLHNTLLSTLLLCTGSRILDTIAKLKTFCLIQTMNQKNK